MEHKGKAAGYLQFGTLQVNTIVYPFRARKRPYTSDYEVLAKPIECRVAEFIGWFGFLENWHLLLLLI